MGTVQRLVSAAASVGDGRSPLGCITRAGRRECPPVGGGEGEVPAAPSHGLCGSAGGLPSQSPNGDSSPEGGAKSRLPPWGALVPSGHRSALDRAGRREWTRVSEDGEGKVPAAPSYGLCGSAGGRPSQSPSGDSVSAAASVGRWATSHRDVAAPEGGAKSRLPLWGALVPSGHRSALGLRCRVGR